MQNADSHENSRVSVEPVYVDNSVLDGIGDSLAVDSQHPLGHPATVDGLTSPRATAPKNSVQMDKKPTCNIVKVLAATEVAYALATSLAPFPKDEARYAMNVMAKIQSYSLVAAGTRGISILAVSIGGKGVVCFA